MFKCSTYGALIINVHICFDEKELAESLFRTKELLLRACASYHHAKLQSAFSMVFSCHQGMVDQEEPQVI
jgi:hypothetical protein